MVERGVAPSVRPDPGHALAESLAVLPLGRGASDVVASPPDGDATDVVARALTSPPDGAAVAAGPATCRAGGRATCRAGDSASTTPGDVGPVVAAGEAEGGGSVSVAFVTTSGPPSSLVRDGSAKTVHVPNPSSSTATVPPATILRVWCTTRQ
ncbi:hypothetical protein BH11ACT1_BH11ACT1_09930 [soil metagenome]